MLKTTDPPVAPDADALASYYGQYGGLVRGRVRRTVPEPDVDDVVQQVFLDFWRTRDRFDPARPVVPWLLQIADRRAVDFVRRRTRRPLTVAPLDPSADAVPDDHRTPRASRAEDFPAELVADAELVRDALAALPDDQREALVLAYFGDFTQAQIAERLGVPLGTVKARSFRGLRSLSALLAPLGDS